MWKCIIAPALLLLVWEIIAKTPQGMCGKERIMEFHRSTWMAHSLCDKTNTAFSATLRVV
jgi:hypothetical protein